MIFWNNWAIISYLFYGSLALGFAMGGKKKKKKRKRGKKIWDTTRRKTSGRSGEITKRNKVIFFWGDEINGGRMWREKKNFSSLATSTSVEGTNCFYRLFLVGWKNCNNDNRSRKFAPSEKSKKYDKLRQESVLKGFNLRKWFYNLFF